MEETSIVFCKRIILQLKKNSTEKFIIKNGQDSLHCPRPVVTLLKNLFYCCIADLQCCVNFCCTGV